MRLRTLALGALFCAGAAASAQAQQGAGPPNVKPKRQYTIDALLDVIFDTNLPRSNKATAAARGLVQNDYLISPKINADISQPFGQQVLFVQGSAGYDFHARNTRLDSQRYDLTAGAAGIIGPCRPIAYGTFQGGQSNLADADLTTSKNRQSVTGVAVSTQCGRDVGPGGLVMVQRLDTKNSASQLVIQDSTSETLQVLLTYGAPSLINLSLMFNYGNNEFPNRINPGRPVGDGFFTQTYGVRLDRKFGNRIDVGATASRTHLKREFVPAGIPATLNANTYSADLQYRVNERAAFSLSASREIKPSNRVGKLYDVAEGLQGQLTYRLNSRFSLTLGHSYEDSISNLDTASTRAVVTDAITNTTFASIAFRRPGLGSLELDLRREARDTNLPLFDYRAFRVGLITRVGF